MKRILFLILILLLPFSLFGQTYIQVVCWDSTYSEQTILRMWTNDGIKDVLSDSVQTLLKLDAFVDSMNAFGISMLDDSTKIDTVIFDRAYIDTGREPVMSLKSDISSDSLVKRTQRY